MSSKKKVLKTKSLSKSKVKKPVKKEKKAIAKKPIAKKTVSKLKSETKKKTQVKKTPTKKVITKKVATKQKANVKTKSKPIISKKVIQPKIAKAAVKAPSKNKQNIKNKTKAKVQAPQKIKEVVKPTPKKLPAPKVVAVKPTKTPKEPKPVPAEKLRKQEEIAAKKLLIEQKSKEVLAINNNIPVKSKNEISQSKIASISHSITNPVKRSDSYSIKPEKEPNGKFELEFVVHASADMIYEFISTPSGLSEWFCDDLNIRNGIYTFIWEDTLQQARLLKTIELQLVRFQWVDKTDGSYFELRIQRDDLTNDISLIITDFAENASERESAKLLWHNQIEKLMHVLGSVF